MKNLRIAFTFVSAVFIAAVIPLGALYSWTYAGICAVGAFLFYGLMLLCKQKQEENDKRARYDDLSAFKFQEDNESKNSESTKETKINPDKK